MLRLAVIAQDAVIGYVDPDVINADVPDVPLAPEVPDVPLLPEFPEVPDVPE